MVEGVNSGGRKALFVVNESEAAIHVRFKGWA